MTTTMPLPTSYEETIDIRWSSSATEPRVWLSIEGGESIDPRDPKHLARLPITNSALLNAAQARMLAAELSRWADEMDKAAQEHGDAYLGTDFI